jgi:two-component system, NarL family, response regulator NreC
MIRLLIVESQPAVRRGLQMRLKLEPDVTVVGETGDSLAALSQAAVLDPDVILLDLESTAIDTARFIRALRRVAPHSAVVILSLRDDVSSRRRVLAAGADVFVSKHDYGDGLLEALRQAAAGPQAARALSAE